MFERYTERARRVIFFARYEASQYGSSLIETEHLLLGLRREDKGLAHRFLPRHASISSIRKQIESRITIREHISTSVEVPLSQECKRILNYAAEEAERLNLKHVGTEHLLLGILREEKCFGAEILQKLGLRLVTLREEIARTPGEKVAVNRPKETSLLAEFSRDLTQLAAEGQLDPLAGRERELRRVVRILSRWKKNNPLLIGEPGVGKKALVDGLAQHIANGNVPQPLNTKSILALNLLAITIGANSRNDWAEERNILREELEENRNIVIFVDELRALALPGSQKRALDAADILKSLLLRGDIQCITAATPSEYQKSIETAPWLERCFQVVKVPPLSETETIQILQGLRRRYEEFHSVSYTDEVIHHAVTLSNRYIPDRSLPGKAIDLIDEAGAYVKLSGPPWPDEVYESHTRLGFIVQRMEAAIANHEFEKARFYSQEERKEKENLRLLRERYSIDEKTVRTVTCEDLKNVIADWTGLPTSSFSEQP